MYKIGLRPEFPTVTNNLSSEHNYTTSLKNYNAPTNDEPLFVTDSTTVLLSGVSNLALNGNITIFKISLLEALYQMLLLPIFSILNDVSITQNLGGQSKLPAPQTLGGTGGKKGSEKGGLLFGRSESFRNSEHIGKCAQTIELEYGNETFIHFYLKSKIRYYNTI